MSAPSQRASWIAALGLFVAAVYFALLVPEARPAPRPPEPQGFGGYLPVHSSSGGSR